LAASQDNCPLTTSHYLDDKGDNLWGDWFNYSLLLFYRNCILMSFSLNKAPYLQ